MDNIVIQPVLSRQDAIKILSTPDLYDAFQAHQQAFEQFKVANAALLAALEQRLMSKYDELKSELDAANASVDKLKTDFTAHLAADAAEHQAQEEAKAALTEQLTEARAALETANQRLADAPTPEQMDALKAEIQELEAKIADLEAQLNPPASEPPATDPNEPPPPPPPADAPAQ